jgi:hypothetical protein
MMIRNGRWLSALAFGALLTSCSGGASPGSGTALTPAMSVQPVAKATTAPSPGAASPTTGATTSSFPAGTTAVSLTVAIPQRTASAHSRKTLGTASTITGIQAVVTINSFTYPAYAGTCGATTCSVTFPISLQYNTGLEVDLLAGYNAVQASVTTIPVSSLTEGTNNPITLPPFKAIVGAIEVQSTTTALYSNGIPQTVPVSVTLLDPNGGDVYGTAVLDSNRQPLTNFTLTLTSDTTINSSNTFTQTLGGSNPVSDFSYTATYDGGTTATQSITPGVPGGNFVSSLPALLGYVTPAMITLSASGGFTSNPLLNVTSYYP